MKTSFGISENGGANLSVSMSIRGNNSKQINDTPSQHVDFSKEIGTSESVGQPNLPGSQVKYVSEERQNSSGMFSQILDLLRTPSFYAIVIPIVVADFTLPLLATTLIDYTGDKGVPLDAAALLLSCLSVGTFGGRLVIPFLSDRTVRNRCITASVTFALVSLCFVVFPHIGGTGVIAVVTILAGSLQGYLATIKSVLVADYLGVQKLAVSWGVIGLVSLPLTFCEPSIVGAFRDSGGSYDNLYRSCGAASMFAALLLLVRACLDAKKAAHKGLPLA
ncbi:uncharacterized protein LOC144118872 [Amblyomma americanum]